MDQIDNIPEFGIKRENEKRRDGGCGVVFDPETQKYAVGKETGGLLRLFAGGLNEGEDMEQGVLREVVEESGLHDFLYIEKIGDAMCHFYSKAKKENRLAYATCFLIILKSRDLVPTKLEEHEQFSLAWASPKEIIKNWEERNGDKDFDHWVYFLNKSIKRVVELGYAKKVSN